jgi:beta-fructofuranosidase
MWAWLAVGGGKFQGGVQCLPRELSLPEDGVLRIKPLKELQTLREDPKDLGTVAIKAGTPTVLEGVSGNALELSLSFKTDAAKAYGLKVLCDNSGQGGMTIRYDPKAKTLLLDTLKVPFELPAKEDLNLRVFVDHALIEVFANDRLAPVAVCTKPAGTNVSVWSDGGNATALKVQAWKMKSAY